jgi:hypothetical protein
MVLDRTHKSPMKTNLKRLFEAQQTQMLASGGIAANINHPGVSGDVKEIHWQRILDSYLPKRYQVEKAIVVDVQGETSDQIDIVIFDRQYTPFLLNVDGAKYVPAEGVYAVFEVKPDISLKTIDYAGDKVASVRCLTRTSVPYIHTGRKVSKTPPPHILGGILTSFNSWASPFPNQMINRLKSLDKDHRLEIGCILDTGSFEIGTKGKFSFHTSDARIALVSFVLQLTNRLRNSATVPALDIDLYLKNISSVD